ncbi:hypothetical protein D3C80_1791750 [compost metagenome]
MSLPSRSTSDIMIFSLLIKPLVIMTFLYMASLLITRVRVSSSTRRMISAINSMLSCRLASKMKYAELSASKGRGLT